MNSQKLVRRNGRLLALKVAILETGRTQRATARRLRMDETRLCKIISGKESATVREQRKLSKFTGKPVEELFAVAS